MFALSAGAGPAGPPLADYPQAHWLAASSSNYTTANRPLSGPINMVVIHVTDGSYAGTLQWFRNPRAHATTQYVIRSSDGDVTQMVREKDEAWHSGNGDVNDRSIGIEHEGFTNTCSWMTDAMYRSSAQLSAYLAINRPDPDRPQALHRPQRRPGTPTIPGNSEGSRTTPIQAAAGTGPST